MRNTFALIAFAFVTACSHPLEIVGEGDIMSASGDRTCLLEDFQGGLDNCSNNYVAGAYQETYYAVPRSGWQFDAWVNYCADATGNECSFNYAADTVRKFWGTTVPPLQAVFTEDPGVPIDDTVIVDGKEWAQVDLFTGFSWDDINAVCPDGLCTGQLGDYDMEGWTFATVDDVNGLFNYFLGTTVLGLGPDHFSENDSIWAPAFFAAGFRPITASLNPKFTSGLTATSTWPTRANLGEMLERPSPSSADEARTDTVTTMDYVGYGAWFYRTPILSVEFVTVDGKDWAQPDHFLNLTWNEINAVCPSSSGGVCESLTLNGYEMSGWAWASVDDVNTLFNYFLSTAGVSAPDLLLGPDSYLQAGSSWAPAIFDQGFRPILGDEFSRSMWGWTSTLYSPQYARIGSFTDLENPEYDDNISTTSVTGVDEVGIYDGAYFYRIAN